MDHAPLPTILIIVGITGDLAKRKLLPAVEAIARAGALPEQFRILGITRQTDIDVEILFAGMQESSFVRDHLSLFTMDVNEADEYERLTNRLAEIEQDFGVSAQRLFYLSVPPRASLSVIETLGKSGLADVPHTKLLLAKTFGTDLASAKDMIEHIDAYFSSEQIYRIDHYVAKEMAQNLIVFREDNALFRRTWNNAFIERIEILASEKIGIEGRVDFYQQTGALRDLVQSHLLQLAALMLMEPAREDQAQSVPERRRAALAALRLPAGKSVTESVKRGQYRSYRDEIADQASMTETFVSLTLASDAPHVAGIPITLTTGKMLDKKTTEIRVFYKKEQKQEANELVLRLQPDEGVSLCIWSKKPGYEDVLEKRTLAFDYAAGDGMLAEAYEKILVDTMRGEHALFISSEEVLESWRILAPVQEAWEKSSADLFIYEDGSNPKNI